MTDGDLFARLRRLAPARRRALVARLSAAEVAALTSWEMTARPAQLPPPGTWRTWLMLAGRGFGKTRAGAEWIRSLAEGDGRLRIALVGASAGDGALDGLSFGYRVRRAGRRAPGGRELLNLDLLEISLVTFPMQPLARVHAVSVVD